MRQIFLHFHGTEKINIWVQDWSEETGLINKLGAQLGTPKDHNPEAVESEVDWLVQKVQANTELAQSLTRLR